MSLRRLFPSSIKWLLSLGASALTIALIAVFSVVEIGMIRSDLVAGISDQQSAFLKHVATELDTKLADDLQALTASARQLPSVASLDRATFAAHYERQGTLLTLFDNLVLFDTTGSLVAGYPRAPLPNQPNVADRDYFQEVLRTGRPVISEPLRSRATGEPLVVLATPVLGTDGRVDGVLTAVLFLHRPNLLGALAHEHIGRTGYFFILTTGHTPVYVVHPDSSRILNPRPARGTPSTARALAGFEGTVEDTNSNGVHSLFSYARLKSTGWLISAVLPTDEAFVAVDNASRRVVVVATLAALIVTPLIWFLAWRLLTPLSALCAAVRAAGDSPDHWIDVPIHRRDEVGTLAVAFNALMRHLSTAQSELKAREQWLRSITDNLPALVCYIDQEQRFRFNNRTYERWLDRPCASITDRTVEEIYGAEVMAQLRPASSRRCAASRRNSRWPFRVATAPCISRGVGTCRTSTTTAGWRAPSA